LENKDNYLLNVKFKNKNFLMPSNAINFFREGLNKLKDIYSKNQKFGDSQSADAALKANEEKLTNLNIQLAKYQEILNQVEMNGAANQQQQQHQQHYSSSSTTRTNGEYSSSSSSMTSGTLPRDLNKSQNSNNHIYQSPTKLSVESLQQLQNGKINGNINPTTNIVCSLPNTPMSSHNNNIINQNNGTVAYAVSPVNHINQNVINNSNKAPLVSTNNNESFDDDDQNEEDDDDDDEVEEDGCYESPTAALRNKIENYHLNQKNQTSIKTTSSESELNGVVSLNSNNNNNNINGYYATHSQGAGSGNGSSSCNGSEQYDHVDHNVYDTTNGIFVDDSNEPIIGTALVMYSFAGNFS
jgi:hypothetical protein